MPSPGGWGAIAKTEEQVPDFVESEAGLPCSLDDGETMEHRVVVAPLTTDPLRGKEYANPFVIADRGRAESKLSGDLGDGELRHG